MGDMQADTLVRRALVMDDQEMLREVAADMLEELGYQVIQAEHGEQAVELYAESMEQGRVFDLVLMDLTIPQGMGGVESAGRIVELDAQARIIVCTGHTEDDIVRCYRDYGFSGVICKPYRFDEFEQAVRVVVMEKAG